MLRVTVTRAGDPFLQVHLPQDEILIGRGEDVDVALPSEAVSRRHARLQKRDGVWQVSDLGAANGVYVLPAGTDNAERVVLRVLAPGDRIQIENFVLLCEEAAGAATAGELPRVDAPGATATTARTQFISMVDVLAAREAAAAADAADQAAPATSSQVPRSEAPGVTWPSRTAPTVPPSPAPAVEEAMSASASLSLPASPSLPAPPAAVEAATAIRSQPPSVSSSTTVVAPTSSSDKMATSPPLSMEPAKAMGTARAPRSWRLRLTSAAGHDVSVVVAEERALVGSRPSCDVVLPKGPPLLLELERVGAEVEFHRRRWWPLPQITLDGRRVSQGSLSHAESLRIGGFELTVHLRESD
ncbi:MAG: FHA domain-containing protein [Myxococcota bacterium]